MPCTVCHIKVVIFLKGEKIEIPIKDENIKTNDKIILNIIKVEETSKNNEIYFYKKSVNILLKSRLSQSNGLLYIVNNNDDITDCILYYDSKSNELEKLKTSKSFKRYLYESSKNGYKPYITDIKGNTVKKKVKKNGKSFVINNK